MKILQTSPGFAEIYNYAKSVCENNGFGVIEENVEKPWGAYLRLSDSDAEKFIKIYFKNYEPKVFDNLSPKFLLVAPQKRLSWQKHARRAELWTVLRGPVGAKISTTDFEPEETTVLQAGDFIEFDTGVRHRLIGLDGWGVVTEIWKHTKAPDLSDEADIVRIQDDFAR